MKAEGRQYLTTPNPAALIKLVRLVLAKNNEPFLEKFMLDETFTYNGPICFQVLARSQDLDSTRDNGGLGEARSLCTRPLLLWKNVARQPFIKSFA
jgi:hypothetical protein